MIGIIGPQDSVDRLVEVASELSEANFVIARTYSQPEEAIEHALELDSVCDVILFTGRLPYAVVAAESRTWNPELRYIPHTGTDLYRTLVRILMMNEGVLPRLSVDTIDDSWVAETFADIGRPAPEHLFSFASLPDNEVPSREAVVEFHVDQWEAGTVDVCVTCLGVVHDDLVERGIPTWRIDHTRTSLREALERARLRAELMRSRSTHMALAFVRLPDGDITELLDPYDAQMGQLKVREMAVQMSRQLRGHLARSVDSEFLITTSRGMVDETMTRLRAGQRSAVDIPGLPEGTRIGFGVGITASAAEENARKAAELSEHTRKIHAILANGEVINAGRDDLRMRDNQVGFRPVAESLGLGPLSFSRLLSAIRRLDATSLTARQLAEVYGIEARSARRLLGALAKAGYAREAGREASARAGRPQTVFAVDVHALSSAGDVSRPTQSGRSPS